ncbi:MAG: hypothetical protein ACO3CS_12600, partial [Alphaproteobacteria bacterium]
VRALVAEQLKDAPIVTTGPEAERVARVGERIAEASRRRPARHEAQCRACLRAALAPPVGTAAPHQHSEEAQCSVAT